MDFSPRFLKVFSPLAGVRGWMTWATSELTVVMSFGHLSLRVPLQREAVTSLLSPGQVTLPVSSKVKGMPHFRSPAPHGQAEPSLEPLGLVPITHPS